MLIACHFSTLLEKQPKNNSNTYLPKYIPIYYSIKIKNQWFYTIKMPLLACTVEIITLKQTLNTCD